MSRFRWTAAIGAAILMAACNGAGGASDATLEATIPATDAVEAAITSQPTDVVSTEAATAEMTTEAVAGVGKRDAPIAVDAGFHNDAATVFGATGKPQLLEAFAYW